MQVFMEGSALSTVLVLMSLTVCCSAYIQVSHQHADATLDKDMVAESRRFGWIVDWLNERGAVGQFIGNLVVAMFVLPPLGPVICSFLENCDIARAHARHLARSLTAYRSRSLNGPIDHTVQHILNQIDAAYDMYS